MSLPWAGALGSCNLDGQEEVYSYISELMQTVILMNSNWKDAGYIDLCADDCWLPLQRD